MTRLKSTVLLVYLAHVLLLNSSAEYRRWLAEIRAKFDKTFQVKLETCKKSELSVGVEVSIHTPGSLEGNKCTWRKRRCFWDIVFRGS